MMFAFFPCQPGEEIFVSYNYCMGSSPPWSVMNSGNIFIMCSVLIFSFRYQELWWQHCLQLGWGRQQAESWANRWHTCLPAYLPTCLPEQCTPSYPHTHIHLNTYVKVATTTKKAPVALKRRQYLVCRFSAIFPIFFIIIFPLLFLTFYLKERE